MSETLERRGVKAVLKEEKEKLSVPPEEAKFLERMTAGEKERMKEAEGESKKPRKLEADFSWWRPNDSEFFFVITTRRRHTYEKGEQLMNCYGRRNNKFLLSNYGFVLEDNKYDSLVFRIWHSIDPKKKMSDLANGLVCRDAKLLDSDEVYDLTQEVRLKSNRLNDTLLAYLRANGLLAYEGKGIDKVLVSTPVIVEYEIEVLDYYV